MPAKEKEVHAKRNLDKSIAAKRAGRLGIPLARTRGQRQTDTSQNRDGTVNRLVDEATARQAISALAIEINADDARTKKITTVSDLAQHYRQRELKPDTVWKTHSTKVTYEGYLNKWILPQWENYPLARV